MRKSIRRIMSIAVASVTVCAMLTGCKSNGNNATGTDAKKNSSDVVYTQEEASSTKALVVGDYDIYMDELMVYAINDIVSYKVTPSQVQTDPKTQKSQVLSLLRETKIQYDVTQHNNVELTSDDIATKDAAVENFKKVIPAEVFDKYGISDEVIDKVFTERAYVEKFTNDIKNDMGQKVQDDLETAYADYKFHKYYYMVFPTVEVDTDNSPIKGDDGNYKYVDDDTKADVLASAVAAAQELRDGANYEDVAKKYNVDAYSSEQTGYVGAYSDKMNDMFDKLNDGDVSDVIESELGYTIICMIDSDNQDIKDNYIYAVAQDALGSQFDTLKEQWLSTIPVDEEKDMVGDAWDNFDFLEMTQMLNDEGLIK